ncbi:hypothetical protein BH23CHL2_BH23CHL2_19490 [soil metagenome]
MNSAVDRFIRVPVVRRSAALVAILSIAALLLQGFAEQGGIGSDLSPVPEQPLPFPRERIFGIDLSDRPSLETVEWLQATGSNPFALALIRVDADIVAALRNESAAASAFRALDQLMAVTLDTNVALCLERPVTEIDDELLAELTIDALRERYPNRIAYVTSCSLEPDTAWETSLAVQVRSNAPASPDRLLPLSTGAVVELRDVVSFADVDTNRLRTFSGDTYVLPVVPVSAPLNEAERQIAAGAIRDAAQIGLILLRPDRTVDPVELAESMAQTTIPEGQLPEGFSGVTSPVLDFDDNWEPSTIGRVAYMRAPEPGATLQTVFSGTTLYLQALHAPGAGSVAVWVDPDPADPGPPDREFELNTEQARDASVVLAEGLDAQCHTVAMVVTAGTVTISGLYVSGQPASGWYAGLSALGLMAVSTTALAIVGLARVQDIRDRNALPPGDTANVTHPRAYRRDA